MPTLIEADVEQAALDWLEGLGWRANCTTSLIWFTVSNHGEKT